MRHLVTNFDDPFLIHHTDSIEKKKKRLSNYEQSTKNITNNSVSGNKKENNKDDDLISLRNIKRNLSFNDDDFFGMKDDVKDELKEDSDLKEDDDDKDDIFSKNIWKPMWVFLIHCMMIWRKYVLTLLNLNLNPIYN